MVERRACPGAGVLGQSYAGNCDEPQSEVPVARKRGPREPGSPLHSVSFVPKPPPPDTPSPWRNAPPHVPRLWGERKKEKQKGKQKGKKGGRRQWGFTCAEPAPLSGQARVGLSKGEGRCRGKALSEALTPWSGDSGLHGPRLWAVQTVL